MDDGRQLQEMFMGQDVCNIPAFGNDVHCLCFKVPKGHGLRCPMLVLTVASTPCSDCVLIKLSCCNFLAHTDRAVLEPQDYEPLCT